MHLSQITKSCNHINRIYVYLYTCLIEKIIHDNVFFIIDNKDYLCKQYVTTGKKTR